MKIKFEGLAEKCMAQKSPEVNSGLAHQDHCRKQAAQRPSWPTAFSNQKLSHNLSLGGGPYKTQLACNHNKEMALGTSLNFCNSIICFSFFPVVVIGQGREV